MSYIGRYNKFIESLKYQNIIGMKEMHHITPKSMGGTDNKNNLIALTPRQHYIAHWMLWKAYGGKMSQAFWFMNNFGTQKKLSSKVYEKLREEAVKSFSGENSVMYGKKTPEHTKQKQSIKRKQYMSNPEARENLRKHRANQIITKESYTKASKKHKQLIWMNDGIRSYRIYPEFIAEKIAHGLVYGRLITYINDKFKENRSKIAKNQWQKVKDSGHTGNLIRI